MIRSGFMAMTVEYTCDEPIWYWFVGPEQATVRWCLSDGQALSLVVYGQSAIEPLMYRYLGTCIAGPGHPRLDLQAAGFEAHHVVRTNSALILEAEDLLGDEAGCGWPIG